MSDNEDQFGGSPMGNHKAAAEFDNRGFAAGPTPAPFMGIPVKLNKWLPEGVVIMAKDDGTLQKFLLGVNTLADQEREIEKLRAALADALAALKHQTLRWHDYHPDGCSACEDARQVLAKEGA